eukprot:81262-Ditylum_brightwellii.AAC.1
MLHNTLNNCPHIQYDRYYRCHGSKVTFGVAAHAIQRVHKYSNPGRVNGVWSKGERESIPGSSKSLL